MMQQKFNRSHQKCICRTGKPGIPICANEWQLSSIARQAPNTWYCRIGTPDRRCIKSAVGPCRSLCPVPSMASVPSQLSRLIRPAMPRGVEKSSGQGKSQRLVRTASLSRAFSTPGLRRKLAVRAYRGCIGATELRYSTRLICIRCWQDAH